MWVMSCFEKTKTNKKNLKRGGNKNYVKNF